jgi:hypothetical protein
MAPGVNKAMAIRATAVRGIATVTGLPLGL